MASADIHTTMVNALPMGLYAVTVVRRTTGLSNVEALGGGTVCQDVHPPWEGQRNQSKEDPLATSSSTKAGDGRGGGGSGQSYKKSTPKRPGAGWGKPHKITALTVAEILPGPSRPPQVTGLGTKVVSIKADLLRPAHPPKITGEQFINTFMCDALRGNDNEEYSLTSDKGKAYTDTDSDGKTEIITDITCKFKSTLIAMEVKVDPGSKTNCIPLSHFRCLFPQLCRKDGNPRENTLKPTWLSLKHMMENTASP